MFTPTRALPAFAAAIALLLLATACGSDTSSTGAGNPSTRAIDVAMTDNAYAPISIDVATGETVTLKFRNDGTVVHEAVLGDEATQMRHHEDMTASTGSDDHGMAGHDAEDVTSTADTVTVEPGRTASITQTFDAAGTILIGCHEPGHWEDGMKATIDVS